MSFKDIFYSLHHSCESAGSTLPEGLLGLYISVTLVHALYFISLNALGPALP